MNLQAPKINLDNFEGAFNATNYLINLGHTRIGIVGGSLDISSGLDRLNGYLCSLKENDITVSDELIGNGDYSYDKAYQVTKALVSLEKPPTALLVCNEVMTGATLQCLKDNHIKIPQDISVIAFDDPAWASFFNPALTTIRTPRHSIGSLAFETLLSKINNSDYSDQQLIKTELIIRESCKPLNKA